MCSTGRSLSDSGDWAVSTYYLKADEVPDACQDAETTAKLISGLLNAFYNRVNVSDMSEEEVMRIGVIPATDEGYTAPVNHPQLPF